MENFNRRGQALIESLFVIFCIASLLIAFQMMLDHQLKETATYRLSKSKKDVLNVEKNEYFETK